MDKSLVLQVVNNLSNKGKSDCSDIAIDFFINGVDDFNITDYDNPYLFVEDVYTTLENPSDMSLPEVDSKVIECMNYIAHDIADLL